MGVGDDREKLLAQLIEEHAPVPTAEDVLRQARIAHGSTMHFHIGSMRVPQTKQSLVRLQYTTGGVVSTAQSTAADRAAAGAKQAKAAAAAAAAFNGTAGSASPGKVTEDASNEDESAALLVREMPKQITIKPQPRFGSLALSSSMLSSTAAAAAGYAFPHRSSSSASSGAGKDGAGGTGSGEAGGEENGPSHRWNVAAVPMRFNWGGDGADGDATAAAAKAAAAAAAAVKLCGMSLPEDPPASPSAAALAAARAEQALRLQHQRRARRMSAADVPAAYQAHMATVTEAGAAGGGSGAGCSSDGTGLVGEDSEAPVPSRFQMHLAQLLGPEGDVGVDTDGSGATPAAGSPRAGARRSTDAARPRMSAANAAGRQFPQFPSRGIGSAGAGEDLAPLSPSGGSTVAQRLMQARTQLQQQMMQQMQGHQHSTSGELPGAGGALRPTPLAVPALAPATPPAGALSAGQPGSTGTGDFASVGAAGAGGGGSGGLPTDPTAAAALARLARVTRTQAQRHEPQQIWAVDSATAAALTHGADSAFGSGYSYSVYGRGIPGLPVHGFSGDSELGGGGGGGGGGSAGGAGALRARSSGQQAAPPLLVGGGEAQGVGEAGGGGLRGGSLCGTPALDAVAVADPSVPGAGQQQGSAGDPRSSPLPALASPTALATPRPPRQLPTLSVQGALRMSSSGSGGASPGAGGAALPSPGGAAGSTAPGFLGMRGSVHSPAGRQRRGSLSIPDPAAMPPSPFSTGVSAGAAAGVMRSGSSFTPRPSHSPSPAGAAGGVGGASAPLPSALPRAGASGPGGFGVAAAVVGGRSPAAASPLRMQPPTRSIPAAGANSAAGSFSAQGMDEARHGLYSRSGAAGALPPQPGAVSPSPMSSQPAPDSPSGGTRRQRFANMPPSSAPTRTDGSGDGGAGAGIGGGAGGGGDVGAGAVGAAPSDDPERAGIMAKMKKALSFLRKGAGGSGWQEA